MSSKYLCKCLIKQWPLGHKKGIKSPLTSFADFSLSPLVLHRTIQTIPVGPSEEEVRQMPEEMNILRDAYKFRINQLRYQRVGLEPSIKESIRELEVIDILKNDQKLLYIHLHHAMKVDKYRMSIYAYSPDNGDTGERNCLIETRLERAPKHKSVAARVYSPPGRPIAYIYELRGYQRTIMIEDGRAIKSLYQLHVGTDYNRPFPKVRIYSARGKYRLGHYRKLEEQSSRWDFRLYLRVHHELDILSKSIILVASLFSTGYVYAT